MGSIAFGPWEPDSAGLGAAVMADAKNVYPQKNGYAPIPSLGDITTDALPERCVGLFKARTSAGGWVIFAGTTTKLYRLVGGLWEDYSRSAGGNYNVETGDYWSWTQFGPYVIAVNINDEPQVYDIDGGGTNFDALGGNPPQSRYVAVVGDFVVLACHDTENLAITNSAINDHTGWTVGTDLCDTQTFPDGGRVTGVAGGEFGYVIQERVIRRMIFQEGDIAFRFERVENERGAAAGYSVASTANAVFFLSDDGFFAYGSAGLVPIGAQRVNKWFRDNSDATRFFGVIAFADPYAPRIAWAFHNSSSSENFDRLLIYDWQLDRWSYSDEDAQFWANIVTPGLTLEQLDVYGSIDTGVPFSLDSRVWEGGQPIIGAITTSGRMAALESSVLTTARLITGPMEFMPESRALLQSVTPRGVFNDATLAIRGGKRDTMSDAVVYTSSITPSTRTGIARVRAAGRYHEVELTISQSSGLAWTHAQGIDIGAIPDGIQ